MRKNIKLLLSFLLISFLIGCSPNTKNESLYILNWGDYINYDLLDKFEKEYDVEVIISEVESNEAMYEQIKMNRTSFDIAIPSDYMIDQLEKEHLLKEIDYSLLKNYDKKMFSTISSEHAPESKNFIPYFNGTIGIMYSTKNIKDIKKTIEANGWSTLFDDGLIKNAKVGMYNSSRDAFAASLLHHSYSLNTNNDSELNQAYKSLKNTKYNVYGDDNLKKNIVTGNLDYALVYSGDYYEELIVATEEERTINFGYYVPNNTNYWQDGMVIPKDAKNYELAHTFIDFMLEDENAIENTEYIGYASPINSVMDYLESDNEYDYLTSDPFYNPNEIKNLKPESFKFLGIEYMIKLEELFTKSKS
ncbi:extracellular solute-binding protein [Erysipelotrichaceae bacterium OttesenSCG-928-M19]|nr:extracellular solute-binding protein [Erysipelotrichaceae bacterium OttesenSCG-928-M19]